MEKGGATNLGPIANLLGCVVRYMSLNNFSSSYYYYFVIGK